MTDDPVALCAEIDRLRGLLDERGIDPEPPGPPEPEQFGPPTALMWRLSQAMKAATRHLVDDYARKTADLLFCEGAQWPAALHVKVPTDFKVSRIG